MKEKYPSTSRYAKRGIGNFTGPAADCVPTEEIPGSLEKLAVICKRAEEKQNLFHPLDCTFPISNRDRFHPAGGSIVEGSTRKGKQRRRLKPARTHKRAKVAPCWGWTGSASKDAAKLVQADIERALARLKAHRDKPPRDTVVLSRKQKSKHHYEPTS